MDDRIWWHDGDPDWWETERRDGPLFRALASADPFADPAPETREALARVGALLRAVVLGSTATPSESRPATDGDGPPGDGG